MSKSRKPKRNANPPVTAGARRFPRSMVAVLAVALVTAAGFWWSRDRLADAPPVAAPGAAANASNQPAPAATTNLGFEKLNREWQRPDGGYIIRIRSVEPGGKMEAAYFNPRPIHVAKAEASEDGKTVKVFIELRDVNYPGSTYTLTYDPGDDQLTGIYYQAALKQSLDVSFSRLKP